MSIDLPFNRQVWPLVRIVTAPRFNDTYTVQPMWNSRTRGYGFEFLSCTRACLPAVGEATFQYRYGVMNGLVVGAQTTSARRVAGSAWDPTQDVAQAPDLNGYDVRIQMADPPVSDGSQLIADPSWRTVWWGQVEYQEDAQWPGANYPAGVRTYRCVDGFLRAKRWPVNRHSAYGGEANPGVWFVDVEGHPGYNVGNDGRISGNRDPSLTLAAAPASVNPALKELQDAADTAYKLHVQQGSAGALTFTVKQALEDAMRKTRGLKEPIFNFAGDTTLLGDTIAIPVREGDTAWDLVARYCRRERGRGVVFVDWTDDVADPLAALVPVLRILPQTLDDITYTAPSAGGSPTPLPGAANTTGGRVATTKAVDLIGDHRLEAGDFQLSGRNLHTADAVETISEQIQVLVTLSYYDGDYSLEQRWDASKEATFAALLPSKRTDEAWWPMWQLHGLPRAWGGYAKDHNGGALLACDFACSDAGALITSATEKRPITSPLLCKILPDLPIYDGYDYSAATPVRKIGTASLDETGQPARRPPLPLLRVSADKYLTGDQLGGRPAVTVQVRNGDLIMGNSGDRNTGRRVVSNTSTANLGALFNLNQLGVTVGIELPHRIRRRDLAAGVITPRRTVTVRLPDLHLWLAHSGAIWDLDATTHTFSGNTAKRGAMGASGATPGLLRDDRDTLSRIHAMACAWYLTQRQTAKWALRACGFLPSFNVGDDGEDLTAVTYPTMGQLVTTIAASGQTQTINTPITSIHYDHTVGKTTWETDWQELDFQ